MSTIGRLVFGVLLMMVVAGCGNGESTMPPLEGHFRAPSGLEFKFAPDGTFAATGNNQGRFTVDGTKLILAVNGKSLAGTRTGVDEFVLEQGGRADHFFRVASAAAQTTRASTPEPAVAAAQVSFDRAVPLDQYTDLSAEAGGHGLGYVYAAFREPALSDDDKLTLLSEAGAHEADVFKRRELAARELPAINEKLGAMKAQRYYRLTLKSPADQSYNWNGAPVVLGGYDFDKKAFPFTCVADTQATPTSNSSALASISLVLNREERVVGNCLLNVADEGIAKAMEQARTIPIGLLADSMTVYFYVVRVDRNLVSAVPTHARVAFTLKTPSGTVRGPDIDVAFPQPAAQ